MKRFQKIVAVLFFAVNALHCAEQSLQSESQRGFDKELAQIRKKYTEAQLKKLAEIDLALVKLEDLNNSITGGWYDSAVLHYKKKELSKKWSELQEFVKNSILYDQIHPDDIENLIHSKDETRFVISDFCFDYNDFTKFLLSNGANPNNFLRNRHISLPFTIILLAHGGNFGLRKGDFLGGLHGLSVVNKDSPDLALLYYLHGADPQATNSYGVTKLISLAVKIVKGSFGIVGEVTGHEQIDICHRLISNLIKIGVPIDAQVTKDDWHRFQLTIGDTAISLLEKTIKRLEQEAKPWVTKIDEIKNFKKTFLHAQAEVDEAKKKHAAQLEQTLEQLINARGVRNLITEYAQEHVVPPSIQGDLKRIREQEHALREKFNKEESCGAAILPCVVS